ncbi:MAG TPA: glycoside hydrolase family 28 protein [Bryobacteraceae bacterium]|nr:glycoside hydrolase family 28 protein [Bryobacteraceae bacterium]
MQGRNRRAFLRAAAGLSALAWSRNGKADPAGLDGWAQVGDILARIRPPVFPQRDFEITRYGAAGDAAKDCTDAIARAVAACSQAGGGRVVVPAGIFMTGPVRLQSKVEFHVAAGATLRFVRDPKRYLPLVYTRWEGLECLNYSPFIYSDGQDNIAVTGEGTLDGNCDCEHWWPWKGRTNCGWSKGQPSQQAARNALNAMGQKDTPLRDRKFGEGSYLRPNFIEPVRGRNILIDGVTIINSPMFEIHPVLCTNVTVRNVKIASHGPNNDGCDPDSCRDVLIENTVFDTGDDCIAIKSGRNRDGRRVAVPSENIVIRNCTMKDGHGALTIGSEMSGGVRNVFAENCHLDSPNLDQALRFKTNAMRGGTIENVYFRNLKIGQIAHAVLQIDFNYEEGRNGPEHPVVRNIDIRDVACGKVERALDIRGFPDAKIRNVRLERCTVQSAAKSNIVENVEGLELADVTVNGKRLDA